MKKITKKENFTNIQNILTQHGYNDLAEVMAHEIELLEIPDFDEVIEFSYDYCVICGEPNHSNYSIFCEKCNRDIDNANNFISIRNSFGKDSKFTKEDLIEYGRLTPSVSGLDWRDRVHNMI